MNAMTIIASSALAATFAAVAMTSADAQACTTCPGDLVEAFATTDLSGSYIDLKPIGMVETDSNGFTSLKPIGYWATGTDGSVELKPIGSEMAIGDATDLIGLKPIGIIETDSDGYLDVQQMGEINVDSSGTVELPANSRYSSTVDYSSMYTSERLLSGGR